MSLARSIAHACCCRAQACHCCRQAASRLHISLWREPAAARDALWPACQFCTNPSRPTWTRSCCHLHPWPWLILNRPVILACPGCTLHTHSTMVTGEQIGLRTCAACSLCCSHQLHVCCGARTTLLRRCMQGLDSILGVSAGSAHQWYTNILHQPHLLARWFDSASLEWRAARWCRSPSKPACSMSCRFNLANMSLLKVCRVKIAACSQGYHNLQKIVEPARMSSAKSLQRV